MKAVNQTVIKAESFYTIAAKTGCVVQAVEGAKDGGDIRLGKYDHKPEQEWAFVRVGDGVYRIRNRASGKMIDLMMTGTANGTWLHLWEDVGGTSQMWTVRPTPEGTVRLVSSWAGGKCVDTVGLGAPSGAILQIWQETAGDDQLWTLSEVKDRAKRAKKTEEAAPAAEAKVAETIEEKTESPKAEKPKKAPAKRAAVKKAAAPAAEKVLEESEVEEKAVPNPAEAAPTEEKAEAPAKPKRKCASRKKAGKAEK